MLKVSVAVLALCLAAAQDLPASKKETKHLTVTTSASPETPVAGKRVTLAVDVAPKPKMHVYSPGQAGYIGITLTLDADPAFTPAKAKYPAGEKLYMAILKETQLVYAKPFRITQDVTLRPGSGQAPKSGAPGTVTVKGTLRYQACDDTICYLPTTVPVAWNLTLAREVKQLPASSFQLPARSRSLIPDSRSRYNCPSCSCSHRPSSWASCTVSAPIT